MTVMLIKELGCRQGWWWSCVVAVVVLPLAVPASSLGASCRACNYGDTDDVCQQQGRVYNPVMAVDETFCAQLRNSLPLVRELCETFPDGYKVICDRKVAPTIVTCQKQYCPPDDPEHSEHTGDGNHATSVTQQTSNFLFVVVMSLLTWKIV
nr:putative lineage-restricted protein [Crepidula fornicata]